MRYYCLFCYVFTVIIFLNVNKYENKYDCSKCGSICDNILFCEIF